MRKVIVAMVTACIIALVLGWSASLFADGALSDLQKLKAQAHQLKVQLTQCQVQAAQMALTTEQAQLVQEFRTVLAPPDGATFDWTTLTFTEAKK